MKNRFQVRLNESDVENLSILYKHHKISNKNQSDLFRKLLACEVERILHGSQDVKSLGHSEELRLLEGWNCTFRSLIWPHNKYTKKREPKIICTHPMTREILRTNELYIATCKKCHDTDGSAKPPSLPEPKKQVSKPTPKPKQVQRLCEDCKIDISKQPSNHTLCKNCWFKKIKGAKEPGEYDKKPPMGSQAWLRKQQATRMRKNLQPKEE